MGQLQILATVLLSLAVIVAALALVRLQGERRAAVVSGRLLRAADGDVFDPKMLSGLPDPARRYLLHSIQPGTPLAGCVVLEMTGRIALRPGAEKLAMRAWEVLAAPDGFVWRARVGGSLSKISGYDLYADGRGWMRWYSWGLVPLVRAHGTDVSRSAAGRVALEACAWLPSALLPQRGARWEPVDDRSARVRLHVGDEVFAPVLTVGPEGRLQKIEMMRWDPEGLDGLPGRVPWLADGMTSEQTFDGYTIPTMIRAVSRAGTPRANPFFEAVVTSAHFRGQQP